MAKALRKVRQQTPRRTLIAACLLDYIRVTHDPHTPMPRHRYKLSRLNPEEENELVEMTDALTNLWDALNRGRGRID